MLTRTPEPRASTRARAPPGHRQALYHQPHALLRVRQAAPRARVASILPRVQLHDPPGRRLEWQCHCDHHRRSSSSSSSPYHSDCHHSPPDTPLQAYDFLELHRRHGATLQFGGSDQWGNVMSPTSPRLVRDLSVGSDQWGNIISGVELGWAVDGARLLAGASRTLLGPFPAGGGRTARSSSASLHRSSRRRGGEEAGSAGEAGPRPTCVVGARSRRTARR